MPITSMTAMQLRAIGRTRTGGATFFGGGVQTGGVVNGTIVLPRVLAPDSLASCITPGSIAAGRDAVDGQRFRQFIQGGKWGRRRHGSRDLPEKQLRRIGRMSDSTVPMTECQRNIVDPEPSRSGGRRLEEHGIQGRRRSTGCVRASE